MKKFIKAVAMVAMAFSLCACKMVTKTVSSETGQISITIKNNEVSLNHVEYEFPEDYKLKETLLTDPYGISCASIKNDDNKFIGIVCDGKYSEDIDEDNIADAVNNIYMEIHDENDPIKFNEDPFIYGDELAILIIELDDGYAIFIAEIDTPNFVYVTQGEDDEDDEMTEFVKSAVKQLGSEEDYETFFEE